MSSKQHPEGASTRSSTAEERAARWADQEARSAAAQEAKAPTIQDNHPGGQEPQGTDDITPAEDKQAKADGKNSPSSSEDESEFVWWDGTYGTPNGHLAKLATSKAGSWFEQRKRAQNLYDLLTSPSPLRFVNLNNNTMPNVIVFNVPRTINMRIAIHPQAIIDEDSFDGKTLGYRFMHGELATASSLTTTTVGVFPEDMFDIKEITVPRLAWQTIQDKVGETFPFFELSKMDKKDKVKVPITLGAPVPLHLVLDYLDRDIPAPVLMERIRSLPESSVNNAALRLLVASCCQYSSNARVVPFIKEMDFWTTPTTTEDVQWAETMLKRCYPRRAVYHKQQSAPQARPTGLQPTAGLEATLANAFSKMAETMDKVMEQASDQRNSKGNKNKDDDSSDNDTDEEDTKWMKKFKLSQVGIDDRLHFCGLQSGQEDSLPTYLGDMAKSKVTTVDKRKIISNTIDTYKYYSEMRESLTPEVVKCIIANDWAGTTELFVTYENCQKGVSIFPFRSRTQKAMFALHDEAEALDRATHTTVADHLSKTGKPYVPETWREVDELIRHYTNVYHAFSLGKCEVSLCCREIIKLVTFDWPRHARESLTRQDFATILWIIAVQTRYFLLDPKARDGKPRAPPMLDLLDNLRAVRAPGRSVLVPQEIWNDISVAQNARMAMEDMVEEVLVVVVSTAPPKHKKMITRIKMRIRLRMNHLFVE